MVPALQPKPVRGRGPAAETAETVEKDILGNEIVFLDKVCFYQNDENDEHGEAELSRTSALGRARHG